MAVIGLLLFVVSPTVAVTFLVKAAVVILFAVFFRQLNDARNIDNMDTDTDTCDEPVALVDETGSVESDELVGEVSASDGTDE